MLIPIVEDQITFDVSDEVVALGLKGSYLTINNFKNKENDAEFDKIRSEVLSQIVPDLSTEKIEADPVLAGFRELHEKVQRTGKKNVASPENLLYLLLQNGKLPSINLLVDIYNLVSLETHLALGAHDLAKISGNVHLRLTNGQEGFWPLGYKEAQRVSAGEYAYIDDANDVICRLEVRQVEKTKVTLETSSCFFIVQGNSATSKKSIEDATERLVDLVTTFMGGEAHLLNQVF